MPDTVMGRAPYESPKIVQSRNLIVNDPILAQIIDRSGAFIALVLLAPLMIIIALVLKIVSRGPVFFEQARVGRGGRMFLCRKFRTMSVDAEDRLAKLLATDTQARLQWDQDHKLKDDPRIFGFGAFLRKSSLDELPQLINVLLGDMSLVGPRPIVKSEIARYGRYFAHYCAVRPGITGLWQINGRNDVDYRRRIAFDVIYVRKGKVGDNIRILAMTVPAVLVARGSY